MCNVNWIRNDNLRGSDVKYLRENSSQLTLIAVIPFLSRSFAWGVHNWLSKRILSPYIDLDWRNNVRKWLFKTLNNRTYACTELLVVFRNVRLGTWYYYLSGKNVVTRIRRIKFNQFRDVDYKLTNNRKISRFSIRSMIFRINVC